MAQQAKRTKLLMVLEARDLAFGGVRADFTRNLALIVITTATIFVFIISETFLKMIIFMVTVDSR